MEPDSTTEPYSVPEPQMPYYASIQEGFVDSTTAPHDIPFEFMNNDYREQVQHVTRSDEADLSDGDYPDPNQWDDEWGDPPLGDTTDDDDDDDDAGDIRLLPSPILIEDSPPPSPC
ncbi:uncharacterized protein [Leptinotarsa decemlineata]|uniref:uncharacterized protein n=1 Tax=Leptinotarsa decemlineata TaxID=7539 RepID=UPI003D30923E